MHMYQTPTCCPVYLLQSAPDASILARVAGFRVSARSAGVGSARRFSGLATESGFHPVSVVTPDEGSVNRISGGRNVD